MELGICLLDLKKFFLDGVELQASLGSKEKPDCKKGDEEKGEKENLFLFVVGQLVKNCGGHGSISRRLWFLIVWYLSTKQPIKKYAPPTLVGHATSLPEGPPFRAKPKRNNGRRSRRKDFVQHEVCSFFYAQIT
ncbi:MAG: hypothetical protein RI601_06705 [Desulfurivibrionaceae bacterium]|nr:hypothetical protein [Desulfurivibrionaceae bacterium]